MLSLAGVPHRGRVVWRYPAEPEAAPVDAIVTDVHTQELVALREAVIAEHEPRTGDLQLAAAGVCSASRRPGRQRQLSNRGRPARGLWEISITW